MAASALAVLAWSRRSFGAAIAVVVAVTVQILLGIATLLSGVELWIAVAHQAMAAVLLATFVVAAHALGRPPAMGAKA